MVFSSFPNPHIDSSNWNHQEQHQQQQQQNHLILQHHGISINNPLLPPPPLPPPLQPPGQPPAHTGPMSSIRPGSMSERARMANIPMPEPGLKCPRCDSTNTKFCYFNNYSLSQPRHFCKTCRRYWTRGGAMRSVPVGGGCRRNKRRSKSSSSSTSAATSSASSGPGSHCVPPQSMAPPTPLSSLRFMSPLHQLADYGGGELGFFGGSRGGVEQWRPQPPLPPTAQLPIFGGLGSSLFRNPFEGVHDFSSLAIGGGGGGQMRAPAAEPVKMERSHRTGEQYEWGGESSSSGNAWTDLSSAINNSSCSTTTAL